MPGRRADEDEPLDELGPGEREVERHPAAERVADVGAGPAALADELRRLVERRPSRPATPRGPEDRA